MMPFPSSRNAAYVVDLGDVRVTYVSQSRVTGMLKSYQLITQGSRHQVLHSD